MTLAVSGTVAAVTITDTVSNATTVPIMVTPAVTALILRRLQGRSIRTTIIESLRGTTRLSVAFAIGYPVVFIAAAAVIALGTGLGTFQPGVQNVVEQGPIYLFPLFVLVAGAITYGEELGWRGYLLPELTERVGAVAATALVGLVWALYHLPALYFGAQATGLGDPVTVAAIQMGAVFTAAAFPAAYSYFLSEGSVIPPVLFHLTWNILNPWVLGNVYTNVEGFVAGQVILVSGEGVIGLLLGLVTLAGFVALIRRQFDINGNGRSERKTSRGT
ncbi:CPBP family intramembrane glutamic endopeptidase [Salinigranum salinum]|uniref:CPBP family intramembrane glutamic endopeptidase n=1 Tax=Salinigranum salinum TaxID=1364937 RepID=UPI001260C529|nr:CPBP family intramembrane glutamic endopeptidase [Salinigranum salinum]